MMNSELQIHYCGKPYNARPWPGVVTSHFKCGW